MSVNEVDGSISISFNVADYIKLAFFFLDE